jgi:hypothetical protein
MQQKRGGVHLSESEKRTAKGERRKANGRLYATNFRALSMRFFKSFGLHASA